MKTILSVLTAAVLGLSAIAAFAQTTTAPASKPAFHRGHDMARLGKFLELTDAQKAKIKEIVTAAKADVQKATDKAAKMAIWKAAREKIRTDVLTDAQREKLAGVHRAMMLHRLGRELGLTDDQKTKVKDILKTAHADAIKATDKAAKQAVWKAAFEKIKTDVLTADQRTKLQALKAKHKAATQPAPAVTPAK